MSVKRIIEAQKDNVIISDLKITLKKKGDRINLLAPNEQGRPIRSLEQITKSRDLDTLIEDKSIFLYDENNSRLENLVPVKSENLESARQSTSSSLRGGPTTYVIGDGLRVDPGSVLKLNFDSNGISTNPSRSDHTHTSDIIVNFSESVDDRVSNLLKDNDYIVWTYNDELNELTGTIKLTQFTTSNLAEGSNLYFTDERVDDRVSNLIKNGNGITWSYDDNNNSLTPTINLSPFNTSHLVEGSNLYFTAERVDDRVSSLLTAGSNISLTYDDNAGTLTISASGTTTFLGLTDTPSNYTSSANYLLRVNSGSTGIEFVDGTSIFALASHTHTSSQITDFSEAVDDRVSALLVEGTNITLTYDDGSNTLTISSSGGGGSSAFTGLTDTPSNYTSSANYLVRVNSTPDGLEFVDGDSLFASSSIDLQDVTDNGNTTTNNIGAAKFLAADGSESSPSISFTNDTNTGLYSISGDVLGISVGGSDKFQIGTSNAEILVNLLPDTDSTYNLGSSSLYWSTGYVDRILVQDNTAANPALSNSSSSGIYFSGTTIGFSIGGTNEIQFTNNNIRIGFSGSNTAPAFAQDSDTNTGFYFPAADSFAISTGGVEALRADSDQSILIGSTSSVAGSAISKLEIVGTNSSSSSSEYENYIRINQTTNNNKSVRYGLYLDWDDTSTIGGGGATIFPTYYGVGIDLIVNSPINVSAVGARTIYGINSSVTHYGTDSSAATVRDTYGGRFSAVGDSNGTSTSYGIYANASGADTNWAGYFANGEVLMENRLSIGSFYGIGMDIEADTMYLNTSITISDSGSLVSAGASVLNANGNFRFSNGSVGSPIISAQSDPNTGIYFDGLDNFYISTGGSQRLAVSNQNSFQSVRISHDNALGGGPPWVETLYIDSDSSLLLAPRAVNIDVDYTYASLVSSSINTYGIYIDSRSTGAFGASVGSPTRTTYGIFSNAVESGANISGTYSKVVYGGYFSASNNTNGTSTSYGIYATASGADTNYSGYFDGADLRIEEASILLVNTGSSPTMSFVADLATGTISYADPGLYFEISDDLHITGGDIFTQDGSVSGPGHTFINDTDTGMYRITTNTLGLASGGEQRFSIGDSIVLTAKDFASGSHGAAISMYAGDGFGGGFSGGTVTIQSGSGDNEGGDLNFYVGYGISTKDGDVNFFMNQAITAPGNFNIYDAAQIYFSYSTFRITSTIYSDSSGSAGTPIYSWTSDSNTGMYRITTDTLGFSTAGTERIKIESDGDVVINSGGQTGLAPLHVFKSNSAMTSIDAGTTLALESNSTNYLTFMADSGETALHGLVWADSADTFISSIFYQHSADQLSIYSNNRYVCTIGSDYRIKWGDNGSGSSDGSGVFEIETTTTTAKAALLIDQNDVDQAFIRYEGSSSADFNNNISTVSGDGSIVGPQAAIATNGWSYGGMVRVDVNGTSRWMAYYNAVFGGAECPFVYSITEDGSEILEGEIIRNIVGKNNARIDYLVLNNNTNRILIKEEKSEISYIYFMYFEVTNKIGKKEIIFTKNKNLSDLNNLETPKIILKNGDSIYIEPEREINKNSVKVELVAYGYYDRV